MLMSRKINSLSFSPFIIIAEIFFDYIRIMDMENRIERFKKALSDVHDWPSGYTFKFIYKSDPLVLLQLKAIFPAGTEFIIRHSNKKNFQSLSVHIIATSAEQVMLYYEKASEVEGVLAL